MDRNAPSIFWNSEIVALVVIVCAAPAESFEMASGLVSGVFPSILNDLSSQYIFYFLSKRRP
jgi:hypothetical protein